MHPEYFPSDANQQLLHDIIEDTPFTKKELRNDFGNEIADIVIAVTKNSFAQIKAVATNNIICNSRCKICST